MQTVSPPRVIASRVVMSRVVACGALATMSLMTSAAPARAALPPQEVESRLSKLVQSPPLSNSRVGIYVHSITRHREIFAKNPDVLLSPASNTKLVTTAAALTFLKPDYRFKTQVWADAPIADGVVKGNLYIKGGGDPSLISERVWYLANELWHRGLRKITGDVVGDDSFFDEQREQPGWDEDTGDDAYQALASALSVNFNTITVRVLPGSAPGKPGRVFFDPPSDFAQLATNVSTFTGKRTRVSIDVSPVNGGARDQVKVTGKIRGEDVGRAYWRKIDFPTEFATHVIASFLKDAGMSIDGKARRGLMPESAVPVLAIESPRLAEIVDDLNKTSNNFVAEQILKTMGAEIVSPPGTWDKGVSVVKQYLGKIGLAEDTYTLKNGSGLGNVNRLTARELVRVLEAAYDDPMIQPEYVASLGVAGSTGTMRRRMIGTPGQYRVRAKTGSLANACTLSGYIYTAGGEVLAFSFLVNAFKSMAAVHDAQDKLAIALAELDAALAPTPVAKAPGPSANAAPVGAAKPANSALPANSAPPAHAASPAGVAP